LLVSNAAIIVFMEAVWL